MQNICDIKFTNLTHFKCTVQWHQIHSHCCATIITIHLGIFHQHKPKVCPLNSNSPPPLPSLCICLSSKIGVLPFHFLRTRLRASVIQAFANSAPLGQSYSAQPWGCGTFLLSICYQPAQGQEGSGDRWRLLSESSFCRFSHLQGLFIFLLSPPHPHDVGPEF